MIVLSTPLTFTLGCVSSGPPNLSSSLNVAWNVLTPFSIVEVTVMFLSPLASTPWPANFLISSLPLSEILDKSFNLSTSTLVAELIESKRSLMVVNASPTLCLVTALPFLSFKLYVGSLSVPSAFTLAPPPRAVAMEFVVLYT